MDSDKHDMSPILMEVHAKDGDPYSNACDTMEMLEKRLDSIQEHIDQNLKTIAIEI